MEPSEAATAVAEDNDDEDGDGWPEREELAQKPLERGGLTIGVHAELDEHEARRHWMRLPEAQLAVDAMLKEGRARRRQGTVVMCDAASRRPCFRARAQRLRDLAVV